MDPDAVAKAFVEHYYSTFDTNRNNLFTSTRITPCSRGRGEVPGRPGHPEQGLLLAFRPVQATTATPSTASPVDPAAACWSSSVDLQLADQEHALKFSQVRLAPGALSPASAAGLVAMRSTLCWYHVARMSLPHSAVCSQQA